MQAGNISHNYQFDPFYTCDHVMLDYSTHVQYDCMSHADHVNRPTCLSQVGHNNANIVASSELGFEDHEDVGGRDCAIFEAGNYKMHMGQLIDDHDHDQRDLVSLPSLESRSNIVTIIEEKINNSNNSAHDNDQDQVDIKGFYNNNNNFSQSFSLKKEQKVYS